jgi:DNA-directed RNA polymerase specialized sigma24 family protein
VAFRKSYARGVRCYFERDRQLRAAPDEIQRMLEDVLSEGFALTWPAAQDDRVQPVLQRLERDAARECRRRMRHEVSLEVFGDLPNGAEADLLAVIERRERWSWFQRRVGKLSARDRLVIEGRLDGRCDEDLARELDCVVSTVKKRRYRIMDALRREARRLLPR